MWDEQGLSAGIAPDGTLDPDLLKGVHIIVGTPEYLSRVAVGGKLQASLDLPHLSYST